jgi:hypothetical protein
MALKQRLGDGEWAEGGRPGGMISRLSDGMDGKVNRCRIVDSCA